MSDKLAFDNALKKREAIEKEIHLRLDNKKRTVNFILIITAAALSLAIARSSEQDFQSNIANATVIAMIAGLVFWYDAISQAFNIALAAKYCVCVLDPFLDARHNEFAYEKWEDYLNKMRIKRNATLMRVIGAGAEEMIPPLITLGSFIIYTVNYARHDFIHHATPGAEIIRLTVFSICVAVFIFLAALNRKVAKVYMTIPQHDKLL